MRISGARPGSPKGSDDSYIKRLKDEKISTALMALTNPLRDASRAKNLEFW